MNIFLIGMPGSGKSTVGKIIAKKLKLDFIDADDYIEKKEKLTLQEIIDKKGEKEFLKIEQKRVLELLPLKNTVLAPGGSIVYSEKVMEYFKKSGLIIYLERPYDKIEKVLKNKKTRGIFGLKTKSIKQIYQQRKPLYEKYADLTITKYGM